VTCGVFFGEEEGRACRCRSGFRRTRGAGGMTGVSDAKGGLARPAEAEKQTPSAMPVNVFARGVGGGRPRLAMDEL